MDVSPSGSGTLFLTNLSSEEQNDKIVQPTRYPTTYDCFFISHTASVKANPNSGYKFDRWVLDPKPTGFNTSANPAVFTTDVPRRLTAYFTGGSSTEAPLPPTNVSASDGVYNNRVYVTWSASSGATSYDIYRSTSTSGLKPVIGTSTSTNYSDTTAICGTTYYYWVTAKNSSGTSDLSLSNTGNCDSGGVDPPVGAVTALTATQAKAEIDKTTGLNILDVRELIDYETGHLLCAENAAWNCLTECFINYGVIAAYKAMDLLIYDQNGANAVAAANYLAGEGFSKVYYITGGIDAWENQGYEIVTTEGPCSIPPMANAGQDKTATENALVSLDGSKSAAPSGALTYEWTQSSGPSVDLLNPLTATPTFTAPSVQEGGAELVFNLKVTNTQQVVDMDSVSVFVTWTPTASPPEAKAGDDQTVDEGDSVELDAGDSTDPDNDIESFLWTQTGGSPSVTLSNPGSEVVTFTAPDIDAQTTLTFRVTVTDTEDNVDTDDVQIVIQNVTVDTGPVADAGEEDIVYESTLAELDGSGSYVLGGGTITKYQWTQTGGATVSIIDSDKAKATFTAPAIDTAQTKLTFKLVVTSNTGKTSQDTVDVTVTNVLGYEPDADAGSAQVTYGGATVTLNGSMSTDFDGGTIESYQWQQTSGTPVTLSDASSDSPTFVAPLLTDTAVLIFMLTVTDNDGLSDADKVGITVEISPPPVADAGADQQVKEGETVTLDGSSSTAVGGGIKKYLWKQISGTQVSLAATTNGAIVEFEAPILQEGSEVLIFELTVEDSSGLTSSDMVAVTANNKSSSSDSGCFISAME